ncbi:MAG: RNA methyltransferase [Treponema sp.]|jgi:TrmH RNA methyltransferase|nr:RNA methyltransferase [Treponema sp.]
MRNKLTNELAVCGLNAVNALGEIHPEQINRLFLREDRLGLFSAVCGQLAARKRPYKLCDDEELECICKSSHHQGVVAMIIEPQTLALTHDDLNLWAQEGKTGIVLHSIGNDHNLGAIVRSAAFFDADFVVASSLDEESLLTTSAYRVAEGGMEHIMFRTVRNTAAFLKDASQVLITIGAEPRSRWRLGDLGMIIKDLSARLPARKTSSGIALVVGNEETGLPKEVKERCAALVRIPGSGNLDSLNVAQAATLFLHEIYEL